MKPILLGLVLAAGFSGAGMAQTLQSDPRETPQYNRQETRQACPEQQYWSNGAALNCIGQALHEGKKDGMW